ncbi:Phosphoserine aminotransferase [Hibiscus syriacus]|uniref:phosphoserine transaminase n=1 Tax=Hibiscus syriacus TaxID=106335 RepID=A0A6A2Z2K7_HIBSY|nr:phosphoserine aminotransferase 2, chloroplastic-like [Hibiscus syriacus]KAE8685957.1 Phosphoserine aminotransferase [Hibiscus syriacus]
MAATPLTTPHTPLLQETHQSHSFLKPNTAFHYRTSCKPFSVSCSSTIQDRPSLQSRSQDRVFNFAAGPATLPENVLLKAQTELYNWRGSGMSVMEMSHRGKDFRSIIEKAEADLRALLNISEDYAVLFLQGGATTQFASVPLNLCEPDDTVDYLVTGSWGDKAFKEAKKYCKPKVAWNGKSENYVRVPSFDGLELSPDAKYLHICANETIYGVEFKNYPVPGNPNGVLVADLSSNFCSKPVDVTKFGLIYAGAQKNVGPSGVCIVIVRKDLIGNAQEITPVMLDYKIHADNNSLYNTPPCFGIYMCGLVFEDLLEQGGLKEVEKKNEKKAGILYNAIDESKGFYRCPVEKSVRSLMNVPFTLEKSELEAEFLKQAEKEKMVQLKGHRSVGGMRASIYNAMPLAGVEKLVSFMKVFQAKHA